MARGVGGGEDGSRNAESDTRTQSGQGVQEAAGDRLLLGGQRRHDIHVGDSEAEVGADDGEDQGGKDKGPPRAALRHGADQGRGDGVCDGGNGHEELVADAMHDERGDDVDDHATDRLREQSDRHLQRGLVLQSLPVEREPEDVVGEAEEAQTQDDDQEREVPVAPDVQRHERVLEDALPVNEQCQEDDAENQKRYHVVCLPSSRCVVDHRERAGEHGDAGDRQERS